MPRDLEPGELVERYRVESLLGEGGAARVYRVRHTTLGTVHALKLLTLDHPVFRKRLLAEGKAQARLSHPNLVPVRDVLEVDECPALLMDFVSGQSLQQLIKGGRLNPAAAVALFRHVAAGVAYAHSEGVIHRDIKPANVLLDDTTDPPLPRVADFGLVRVLDLPEESTRHTRAGTAMGTPGYMAPEQVRDAKAADARTDVFALGAVLYAMLVGRAPFTGDDHFEIMMDTSKGAYTPLADAVKAPVPPPVIAVVERALQVRPEDRYPSVDAMIAALGGPDGVAEDAAAQPSVDFTPVKGPTTAQWSPTEAEAEPEVVAPPPAPTVVPTEMPAPVPEPEFDGMGAVVSGLVVDLSGRGYVVQIAVQLDPDGTGVQHAPGVERDAQVAGQLAVAVALGDQAKDMGVKWSIRGNTDAVHGTSMGLPLAVAIWCAHKGLAPPKTWAFTGGLDLDGRVAPVSGVPAKVRAAADAGMGHVAVPADGLGALEVPGGLEVVPARTFSGLIARIYPSAEPKKVRPWRRRMLMLVVPILVAFTGLTGRLEPLIHDPLLRAFHGPLPADNTAILAFPPQRDARALRAQHPAVIDALVAQGARTIFFDVTMTAETPHDVEIARAIRAAKDKGVAVVLPVVMEGGQVMLPESEALKAAAWFGPVLAQADTSLWHVRRAPVRIRTLKHGDYWHAAVQSARGHLSSPDLPRVEDDTLIVGPTRNPVWADLVYLHPADPSPVLEYTKPESWQSVRGRTVLVGEMGGSDDIHRTDAETVYGVEIEAALIETLLQQSAPKVASPEVNTLLALLVGVLTAALGLALPRRKWPLALVVPAAALGVSVALVVAGVLIAMLPMALAAAVGIWVGRTQVVTSDQTRP